MLYTVHFLKKCVQYFMLVKVHKPFSDYGMDNKRLKIITFTQRLDNSYKIGFPKERGSRIHCHDSKIQSRRLLAGCYEQYQEVKTQS